MGGGTLALGVQPGVQPGDVATQESGGGCGFGAQTGLKALGEHGTGSPIGWSDFLVVETCLVEAVRSAWLARDHVPPQELTGRAPETPNGRENGCHIPATARPGKGLNAGVWFHPHQPHVGPTSGPHKVGWSREVWARVILLEIPDLAQFALVPSGCPLSPTVKHVQNAHAFQLEEPCIAGVPQLPVQNRADRTKLTHEAGPPSEGR